MYSAANVGVYTPPDMGSALSFDDVPRILANADAMAATGTLGTFDRVQANAFARVFLIATVAYYKGEGRRQ